MKIDFQEKIDNYVLGKMSAEDRDKLEKEVSQDKEKQEQLKKVLNNLDSKERTLFYRKYYYMQSTAQIAREMGTTERAVEGKLYRIKNKIRKQMGGWENE